MHDFWCGSSHVNECGKDYIGETDNPYMYIRVKKHFDGLNTLTAMSRNSARQYYLDQSDITFVQTMPKKVI